MKKLLLPGMLAVFLFLPRESQAVPLDIPYQILISTVVQNATTIVISTNNFPSGSAFVNSNVANYQWCISDLIVSAPSAASFTMFWSTSPLTTGTTDYAAALVANTAYQSNFNYRTPYCAPVGDPILTLKSSVSGSTITASGYLWKGWNP
jgi:hypothetical protein